MQAAVLDQLAFEKAQKHSQVLNSLVMMSVILPQKML